MSSTIAIVAPLAKTAARAYLFRMNLPPLRTLFFEDLSVGMTETLDKMVSSSDVVGFAQLTGDRNPIHLSEHFAAPALATPTRTDNPDRAA